MAKQKRNPAAHELIKQMMAMYQPETMEDVHDMLKDMFSDTLEEMLHAELDAALGYEKHDQSTKQTTNRRNGTYPKTVRGELGETVIDIPHDRNGEYEPVAIPKGISDVSELDRLLLKILIILFSCSHF